jgi:hypothetical protein
VLRADVAGVWTATLEVMYAHEAVGGGLWVARDRVCWPVFTEEPLFWDNFETGTLDRWSETTGR